MDHMRISGNEPSSVSLNQKSSLKVENDSPKVAKQVEARRGGVMNPQNCNFNQY